jgi:hypothetical protein
MTSRSMATNRGTLDSAVTAEESSIQDIWVTQAELLIGNAQIKILF